MTRDPSMNAFVGSQWRMSNAIVRPSGDHDAGPSRQSGQCVVATLVRWRRLMSSTDRRAAYGSSGAAAYPRYQISEILVPHGDHTPSHTASQPSATPS